MGAKDGIFAFLTWRFLATKLFEGALQAVGAVLVYALVIYLVVSGYGTAELKDAIRIKTGGVVHPEGAPTN